ncbi:hypothetical protein ZWY2020_024765 [Hordeum vulgare]|nr:hypothetical protein ZWY2020_024765 [Hordeum vulgare]
MVQVNRVKHHQITLGICTICGLEDQCTFHALVSCPKVRVFRLALRKVWNLPAEEMFKNMGLDWFLILLDQLNSPTREQTIFMFSIVWHLRNDLIFDKGKESISAFVNFVQNYWAFFLSCHEKVQVQVKNKGKEVKGDILVSNNMERSNDGWEPPIEDFFIINVDASLVEVVNTSSVRVDVTNHSGKVVIFSWGYIGACDSVEEAELRGALAGLYIAITLPKPVILGN